MDINSRLSQFLNDKGLSANELSKIIGVQRSTLSHILTGRNKPSLDLIERFYTAFPEISLVWLISGIGEMLSVQGGVNEVKELVKPAELVSSPNTESKPLLKEVTPIKSLETKSSSDGVENEVVPDKQSPLDSPKAGQSTRVPVQTIITYNDGTFDLYTYSHL